MYPDLRRCVVGLLVSGCCVTSDSSTRIELDAVCHDGRVLIVLTLGILKKTTFADKASQNWLYQTHHGSDHTKTQFYVCRDVSPQHRREWKN